jgi:hypothetical protein
MNALGESATIQRAECATLKTENKGLQDRINQLLEEVCAAQAESRRFEEKAGALQVIFHDIS